MKTFIRTNSVKLLSLILLSLLNPMANTLMAQCDGSTVLTVPNTYFGDDFVGNGNFNAIIFGSITAGGGDTEGRLAVAGDFYGPGSYSVGQAPGNRSAPANTDNLIVNGNFDNAQNWGMQGNFIYNTTNSTSDSRMPSHPAGTGVNTGGITGRLSFKTLKTYYENLSTSLAGKTSNGLVEATPWDYVQITLTGTDLNSNVFTLDLPDNKQFGINIVVPQGSTVLINVTDTKVHFNNGSMSGGDRAKILFNFPNATEVNVTGFTVEGQVLAPKASLVGKGGSINGQAIIGGNVTQTNQGFEFHNYCSSFPMPSFTPLPVTLTSFNVTKEGSQAVLNWATSVETNSDRFEIEHSANAKNWNLIGTVLSKGDSKVISNYHYTHKNPVNGQNYYRLKMIDVDGTYAFSSIRNISVNAVAAVTIYPNPVVNEATIQIQDDSKIKDIYLISASGKKTAVSANADKIDMSRVSAGIYVLQVNQLNGSTSNTKIVKQ